MLQCPLRNYNNVVFRTHANYFPLAARFKRCLYPKLPQICRISTKPGFEYFMCQENPRRLGILLFADHPRFWRYIGYSRRGLSQIFSIICDRGTGTQQFRGLVMSESHRRRTPTSPMASSGLTSTVKSKCWISFWMATILSLLG